MAKAQTLSPWFILWWVLATVAGMFAAFVVLLPGLLSVDFVGKGNLALYTGFAALFALAGALVGVAQWLVLRRQDFRAAWIGATAGGLAVAAVLILLIDNAPEAVSQQLLIILLVPAAVSGFQAWQLRTRFTQPWYWVAANYLAFGAFMLLFIHAERSTLVSLGIYLSYPVITGVAMWGLLSNQAVATKSAKPPKPATKLPARSKRKNVRTK